MTKTNNPQSGNVMVLILVAVALFAALSYAVTQATRNVGNIDKENATLYLAESRNCFTNVEQARLKLELIKGCDSSEMNYVLPDGTNSNANAPSDGSCDVFAPNVGGAYPCGAYLGTGTCVLTDLVIGQRCTNADIVYVGESGGNRLYTTVADIGTATWNNRTSASIDVAGITYPAIDGKANTDILVAATDAGAPYDAANICRGLGSDWYLPSGPEMAVFDVNSEEGVLAGTVSGIYWTSSELVGTQVLVRNTTGTPTSSFQLKPESYNVRCMRRD